MAAELSVPVLWVEDGGIPLAGRLDVYDDRLHLDGGSRETRRTRDLAYEQIESVRIGRENGDRVAGRPALVVQLVAGGVIGIAGFDRTGTLHELMHRLEALL